MRIYMQIPALEGKPARFYQLALQQDLLNGWNLVREWGPQGKSGRIKKDHFPDINTAQAALIKVRDTQLNRGFKIVFTQGTEQLS